MIKILTNVKTDSLAISFLNKFLKECEPEYICLLKTNECEPFDFDCDACELSNCFMELEKAGAHNAVKQIFQGNHFYRSDTGKCPRCYRYRPEIYWNNENQLDADVCDRCLNAISEGNDNENCK